MATLTRHETAGFLEDHDNYVILTHRRPDGDTVGSAAFLCRGLREFGKTAHVLPNPEITPKYAPLFEGLTKDTVEEGDTLICVDVAAPDMLAKGFLPLLDKIALRIDHHGGSIAFTPDELVDPESASCAELCYDVLMELFIDMDVPMANALYTAVATDTGCFRYANTTSHSFATAAACAWISNDIYGINQTLFETQSLARLKLQGWLIDNAVFAQDGQIAICALPLEKEQELGLTEDDLDGIAGFPRTIEGVKIAAMLRQEGAETIKISLRAVRGYDAAAICEKFGGGGHKGAAGASMKATMDEAVKAILEAMPEIG